jgi:hypothetical protein
MESTTRYGVCQIAQCMRILTLGGPSHRCSKCPIHSCAYSNYDSPCASWQWLWHQHRWRLTPFIVSAAFPLIDKLKRGNGPMSPMLSKPAMQPSTPWVRFTLSSLWHLPNIERLYLISFQVFPVLERTFELILVLTAIYPLDRKTTSKWDVWKKYWPKPSERIKKRNVRVIVFFLVAKIGPFPFQHFIRSSRLSTESDTRLSAPHLFYYVPWMNLLVSFKLHISL